MLLSSASYQSMPLNFGYQSSLMIEQMFIITCWVLVQQHIFIFFSCWVKEIWLQAKPAFTQHFSFILKVVTRPIHFTSWVGVEITGFCMVRFTIFFPFPFSLHNVFIPAILLKCGFSEGAVISLLSFLMLRGQLCKQCPVHFYLINGCRNECFF